MLSTPELEKLAEVVEGLGLTRVKDDWACGIFNGVPLALNTVATTEAVGLLFHVRYPESQFSSETPPISDRTLLAQWTGAGEAEVSLDSKTGWLNLFPKAGSLSLPTVEKLLTEFFECAKEQGVDLKKRICLTCRNQSVDIPLLEEDRLQLVCSACQNESHERFRRETELYPLQLPLLLIPGVIGALVGAVLWAGCWLAYEWIVGLLEGGVVPILLLIAAFGGAGFLASKPISYFLSRVRNRGVHFGAAVSVLCCASALVVGELLFIAVLCIHSAGFLPPPGLLAHIYLPLLKETSPLYIGGKAVAVTFALYRSYIDALPKKPGH